MILSLSQWFLNLGNTLVLSMSYILKWLVFYIPSVWIKSKCKEYYKKVNFNRRNISFGETLLGIIKGRAT